MKRIRVWLLGLVIAAGVALYMNRDTLQLYLEQANIEGNSDARMRAAEAERAALLDSRSKMESPLGREALARQQGFKKPKEEPLPVGP